ncbi:MAG: polysaccharide pyruvyl transferase family protein [Microcoleaceae cyanobacterium]
MKIFYYQRPDGLPNFGDQLNTWLWQQLLPGFFDDDETTIFVGIGTLLNSLLPQRISSAKKVIIFSTGVGYEKPLTIIPQHWKIYCVRGKISAQSLNLSDDLAIADAGILIRRLFQFQMQKSYEYAYMPHINHAKFAGLFMQKACESIGWKYIDPTDPIEQVLSTINQTKILLTEAMHGAIVADALRVPWIPIITSPRILKLKWQDWCSSIHLTYKPYHLYPLIPGYPQYAKGVRSSIAACSHWSQSLLQFPPIHSSSFAQQLTKVSQAATPSLSSDIKIEQLTIKLEQKIEQLKQDLKQ